MPQKHSRSDTGITHVINMGFNKDIISHKTVTAPTSTITLPPVLSGRGCFVKKVWSLIVSPFSEAVFS